MVSGGPRRRVALYSHDTQGLGHVRRNIAVAGALVAREPATDVLLLTGAPEASALPLPPQTDVVTLPTLSKDVTGRYAARRLSSSLPELLAMRARLLESALTAFAPDLFVVDKVARGVDGELDDALAALRAAGSTRVVLGLREVLDSPDAAVREWHASGTTDAVRACYDAIWVYGDPAVYDLVREYDLPRAVADKVTFTGYLGRDRGEGLISRAATSSRSRLTSGPYVLCLVGGGQDGYALASAFVRAPLPPGHSGVLLTGPYMRRADRTALRDAVAGRPDVRVVEFVPDADDLLAGAAAAVSMAGYNTVCELLAGRKRTLLVPRTTPRDEQLVRAERLQRLGVVDVLEPADADPERIGRWLAGAVLAGPPSGAQIDLDGLRVVPRLAAELLGQPPVAAAHAGPASPSSRRTTAALSRPGARPGGGAADPGRVGYVLKMYPRFSETFIVSELLGLEAAGTRVEIFSLRPPADGRFHEALAEVQAGVTYLRSSGLRAADVWDALSAARDVLPALPACLDELLAVDVVDAVQAVQLAGLVRARALTHLHAHFGSVATTVARLAARLAGVSYSFTAHAKDVFHESVDPADLGRKLADASAVVTVSDFNLDHLRTRYGADAARVVRVYNGLDLARFPFRSPADRPVHVAAVGRLVEKKGFPDLLAALALLAGQGRAVECDLVGTGPLESALREQVAALGLERQVRMHGALPQGQVRSVVQSAAVFAAPCVVGADGNRDGLPTVLLEAMAVGTPCVATPVTGIPEVVQDGRTGLLVPERDPAALAAALARLLDDAPLRVRLASAARQLVEREFDVHRQAARLRPLFTGVPPAQQADDLPVRRAVA